MKVSLYAASVPVFTRMLKNVAHLLDIAEKYAEERKFKTEVLVSSRLAPDMYPLSFQIQSATDRAKFFVARVTGQTAPSWPDDETTFEELRARINKALDFLAAVKPADLDGLDEKAVAIKVRGQDTQMPAGEYLLNIVHPNFYFHVATAYDILRHNGVPVGKRDFVG